VVAAAGRLLAPQFGIVGYGYALREKGGLRPDFWVSAPGSDLAVNPEAGPSRFLRTVDGNPAHHRFVSAAFGGTEPAVLTLAECPVPVQSIIRRILRSGVEDTWCFGGAVDRGQGFHLSFVETTRVSMTARRRRYCIGLAAHVVAGYRVQRALRGVTTGTHLASAVLSRDGRILDARGDLAGPTRKRLSEAARKLDRARCRLVAKGPDEAEALWEAFVEGEYALVESVESDSRTVILAVRTGTPRSVRLTVRERAVLEHVASGTSDKEVGHRLGIDARTVAVHLQSAMRKVGCSSRQSLVMWFGRYSGTLGRKP
jgi:DNA-binding CsgD family transcriptional regulator